MSQPHAHATISRVSTLIGITIAGVLLVPAPGSLAYTDKELITALPTQREVRAITGERFRSEL